MIITPDVLLYPFRSARWKSVFVLGGVLGLIATVMFPVLALFPGFGISAMRQAIRGDTPTLPEWENLGQVIKDALWFLLVTVVYMLPSTLIAIAAFSFMMLSLFIAPAAMIGAGQQADSAFGLIFISAFVIYVIGLMISSLLTLPMLFLAFIGLTRAVAHDSLKAAFEVSIVWQLARTNFANFFIAFITAYGLYFLLPFIATIAMYSIVCSPFYYPILAVGMMYISLVGSVLFGLAYRDAQSRFAMAGMIA